MNLRITISDKSRLSLLIGLKALAVLLLAAGLALGLLAGQAFEARGPLTRPLILQGIAVILFVIGFLLARGRLPSDERCTELDLSASHITLLGRTVPRRWIELFLLAMVMAVAALARTVDLANTPYGLWFDEADLGLAARRAMADPQFLSIFSRGYSDFPAIFFYVNFMTVFLRVFGEDSVGVRSMFATAGILSVLGFYLLARYLFGTRVALVVAFLLATSRWHINFSRIGMPSIFVVLFEVFALYFVFRGLKFEKRRDFVWAGLAIGLSLYGYYSSVLIPVLALLLIGHKAFFERWRPTLHRLQCVVVLLATIAIVCSPIIWYAKSHPEVFMQRPSTVLIFNGKTPQQSVAAVLESTKKHLLMFNYAGDNNGRHNLPGAPMLDLITSTLAILGLGYSIFRLNRSAYFIAVVFFLAMLAPGIFSLDFEAPQANRDMGVVTAVYLFVAIALFQVFRLGRWALGRRFALVGSAVLVVVAAYVGYVNLNMYFNRQMSDFAVWASFSIGETLAARIMAAEGADKNVYVSPFLSNQPTLRFLAPNVKTTTFQPQDALPFRDQLDRDTILLLDPSYEHVLPMVKSLYPDAEIRAETGPQNRAALWYVSVPAAQANAILGLDGRYYDGLEFEGQPVLEQTNRAISFDWRQAPLPRPFSAVWSGSLLVPAYDTYTLGLESTEWARLFIDGQSIVETQGGYAEQSVKLAKGLHSIEVRAKVSQDGSLKMTWSTGKTPRDVVPSNMLYVSRVPNNGVIGYYYPNDNFSGSPAYAQIDRTVAFNFHVFPLPRPYSIEWYGKIQAPETGTYRFGSESIDYSSIYIDGQLVVDNKMLNRYLDGSIPLAAGWHDLRVRFMNRSDYSHVHVYWTLPGGQRELLPWDRLRAEAPLTQSSPAIAPAVPPVAAATVVQPTSIGQWGSAGIGNGQFDRPRDLIIDASDRLYVLDYGNQRIQKFSLAGEFLSAWGGRGSGDGRFQDLTALALGPDGSIYALDGDDGIQQFDADGKLRRRLDLQRLVTYHPRGLAVDGQGNIFVVDTGRNRVLKLDPNGVLMTSWGASGSGQGLFLEPSGVAVDRGGMVYVADSVNNRIQKFDAEGRFLREWTMPTEAGGLNGPRLSVDAQGMLYATSTNGQLFVFSPDGEPKIDIDATNGGSVHVDSPRGIAVDRQGLLYLAESGANRIRKLAVQGP